MKSHLKYGLVGGLALGVVLFVSVMMVPENVDPTEPQVGGGFIWWLIRTGIILSAMFLATKDFRDESGGFLKLGSAFGSSYKTGFFILLTYTVVSMLCYYFFIPDWFPLDFDQWMEVVEESSNQDMSKVEGTLRWVYDHLTALVIFGGLFANLIAYLIPALVIGLVLSKENKSEINL